MSPVTGLARCGSVTGTNFVVIFWSFEASSKFTNKVISNTSEVTKIRPFWPLCLRTWICYHKKVSSRSPGLECSFIWENFHPGSVTPDDLGNRLRTSSFDRVSHEEALSSSQPLFYSTHVKNKANNQARRGLSFLAILSARSTIK